jgi:5-methyltetrahydrofolate--homocysteine methyltransferase
MSALLTTTMLAMKRAIDALDQAGLRGRVKILVGGAPVTPQFAVEIGADGSGENAVEAVAAARKVLGLVAA